MNTVEQIKQAVRQLSPEDRAAFRTWFAEFDWEEWNRQLDEDAAKGRLDPLISEARRENQAEICKDR
jgi:hypothetical protein